MVLHGEAEACRVGLAWAISQGWKVVELESDSSTVVAALTHHGGGSSEVSRILDDCKGYLQEFNFIRIRHIFREANSVADRLAHFASLDHSIGPILDEAPGLL
ncbi:putative ribonuclease H-like domain-containing protein [Rosa chinensis]|uniref:Putative ribonuclease H-like domain-containing protein n=1 Tax=Rosa chinensis TaxID=74649 RepID=A0A2P6RCA7_ROSCH|nr:putative ribonuclease H-like domain-containing protein [Rosa chinensis]